MLMMLLEILGCSGTRFSRSFKDKNRGNYSIEIPEFQELLLVAIALTKKGQENRNMVNHSTDYYRSVMDFFGKHRDHTLIHILNEKVPQEYNQLKMDACGFYFDEQQNICKNKAYKRLNWSRKNYIKPILKELQDFAKKSDFRTFYASHKDFYAQEINLLNKQASIEKQWEWLESKFPERYDNYWITFSPLVSGIHATNRFISSDFKQSVMFVKGPMQAEGWATELNAAYTARILFTEIDHNYVNPISDKHKASIVSALKDKSQWVRSGSSAEDYGNEMAVFNEYMTWSVFVLYAFDNYSTQLFEEMSSKVASQMKASRGFTSFPEFNNKMLELYKFRKPRQLEELYPFIIRWCKNHKK